MANFSPIFSALFLVDQNCQRNWLLKLQNWLLKLQNFAVLWPLFGFPGGWWFVVGESNFTVQLIPSTM